MTDIEHCKFGGANLSMACFQNANIKQSRFNGCDLRCANFSYASVADSLFSNACLDRSTWARAQLYQCDCQNAEASHLNAFGMLFEHASAEVFLTATPMPELAGRAEAERLLVQRGLI